MTVSKPAGPTDALRPFSPEASDEPSLRIARALEHIAVVLSGIDNNLQAMVARSRAGN